MRGARPPTRRTPCSRSVPTARRRCPSQSRGARTRTGSSSTRTTWWSPVCRRSTRRTSHALTQPLWLPEPHDQLRGVAADLGGAQVYRGARHLQGRPRGNELHHLPVGACAGRRLWCASLEHAAAPSHPGRLLPDLLYVPWLTRQSTITTPTAPRVRACAAGVWASIPRSSSRISDGGVRSAWRTCL